MRRKAYAALVLLMGCAYGALQNEGAAQPNGADSGQAAADAAQENATGSAQAGSGQNPMQQPGPGAQPGREEGGGTGNVAGAAGQDAAANREQDAGQPSDNSTADPLLRGEYLAKHVAMCVQCHSPRNQRGELIGTRLFHGGDIPFSSPLPNQDWSFRAPRIAGLPGRDAEDLIQVLTTGRDSTGWEPRPPMPPFRMSREDAAAIAQYLESLD